MTDISAGWQALSQGKWASALDQFAGAEDDPEALEGVAIAQWWLDDADATLAVLSARTSSISAGATRSAPRGWHRRSRGTRCSSADRQPSRAAGSTA